jgi:hypothetical protein
MSRSRGSAETESRVLTGVDGLRGLTVVDDASRSREGAVRRRGFWMPDGLWACCRFSREAAGRTERGTGSLESLGMPDALDELGELSMLSR